MGESTERAFDNLMIRTAGALASAAWLRDRGQSIPAYQRWHVEIQMGLGSTRPSLHYDPAIDTRFHIDIYGEEWGFFFCHRGVGSWIRVTDVAFMHGRDDYKLLPVTPALRDIHLLLRAIERDHELRFQRRCAAIHTNLDHA